jgi:hypothetical protein
MPILLRFALGNDEARRLVTAGLLSEEERVEIVNNIIPAYCHYPHHFDSCSFMYSFGKKY